MHNIPSELKYNESHEWIRINGDEATVGITEYAQSLLGDLVYVELPEIGDEFAIGDDACVVESVKAASDVYAPIDGEVIEINETVSNDPALVNSSPYQDGWLFKLKITDESQLAGLMSAEKYTKSLED